MKNVCVVTLLMFTSTLLSAAELYTEFPNAINKSEKYVFYSHGYIVEGENEKPVHPRWGVYDFPLIKKHLSDDFYNLIAYHRAARSEPFHSAKRLANDVNRLIEAGVEPANITLIGFSRGGALSILASNELKNNYIRVIVLAGCAGLIKEHSSVQIYGNVRSIYETSDQVGSCQFLIDRSESVTSFEEIAISTGKEHGAFYLPRESWIKPVKNWIVQ